MMSFDQLAERSARQVGAPWFFALVVLAIVAWLPTVVLWDTGSSDLLVDALTNPLSLLLLLLLQNSQYRSDVAKDDRQDALEQGLALALRQLAEAEDDEGRRQELHEGAQRLIDNAERSSSIASAGDHER
jgi:low affinity Fe/Cu permease